MGLNDDKENELSEYVETMANLGLSLRPLVHISHEDINESSTLPSANAGSRKEGQESMEHQYIELPKSTSNDFVTGLNGKGSTYTQRASKDDSNHEEMLQEAQGVKISSGHGLRADIVENLIALLDEHNELVKLFRTARDKMSETNIPQFKVHLFGVVGSRQHELPTCDSIGAIVFEGGPDVQTDFDVVVEQHDHRLKQRFLG
ncbi:hypothetical protein CTI12_AA333640 [Artemisia annua]|uniref:Uncharacterized protein n=1 Tax=Artemisia annua TaxID=35608 RepID=A0A2U1MX73_ARTAN|nr:hypothetical protein CTI12_AA333640 [Artemisia annua]